MKTRHKLTRSVLAVLLCLAIACAGFSTFAFAAVDSTKIFTEAMDDDEMSENRWALSKSDSDAVGMDKVGKPVFSAAADNGKIAMQYDSALQFSAPVVTDKTAIALQYDDEVAMTAPTTQTTPEVKNFEVTPESNKIALQYDDEVTLSAGEFVETDITLSNIKGTPTLWFGFGAKADSDTALADALAQEGVELKLTNDNVNAWGENSNGYGMHIGKLTMHTQNAGGKWRHPIGGSTIDANTETDVAMCLNIEGLGYPGLKANSYENMIIKWRMAADGTATLSIGEKSRPGNLLDIQLGYGHDGANFVKYEDGTFTQRAAGYPQIYISGMSNDVIVESYTVTQYENANIAAGYHAGTQKSGGAEYTETFASSDSSKCKFIAGTAKINNVPGSSVTVYAEQYVQTDIKLTNLKGEPTLWFGFGDKAESDTALAGALAQEGVEVKLTDAKFQQTGSYFDGSPIAEITLHTQHTGAQWRNPQTGAKQNANTKVEAALYNSNAGLHTPGIQNYDNVEITWQVHADGRAVLGFKQGSNDWMTIQFGGWHNGAAWVLLDEGGMTARNAGHPQIYIADASEAVEVTSFTVAQYDETGYSGVYSGTKTASGTDYTESFTSADDAKLKFIAGTATFADSKASVAGKVVSTTTVLAKEYIEYTVSFANVTGTPEIFFSFGTTKATTVAGIEANEGIGVKFLASDSVNIRLESGQEGTKFREGWTGDMMTGGVIHSTNGSTLGVFDVTQFTVRFRLYSDGTAIISEKDSDHDWYHIPVGWSHNGASWVEQTGFTPIAGGYPQIVISGAVKPVSVTGFSAGIYDYETANGDAPAGTLRTETTLFEESFASVEDSHVEFITGTATLAPAASGIVINNAAADDYLIKKTALSKPDDNRAPVIYEISADLFIEELSGNGKAVMYLGADDTGLTNAIQLTFTYTDGKVMVTVGDGEAVEIALKLGTKFTVEVICGGNVGETPYTNVVKVEGAEAGEFVKNMTGTYIAFGTTGISEDNAAKFAVMGMSILKHSYTAGEGGDFVETFDDDLYNAVNVTIYTPIIHVDPNTIFYIKDGAVYSSSDCGYTSVISSTQTYGDFELEFEISAWNNIVEYSDLMISWGRPSGDSDYAAGGTAVMLRGGSGFACLDPKIDITAASMGKFPTDKTDADGAPMGTSANICDYNFSQGNVVFKVVKQGTVVNIYVYLADSAEDDARRTTAVVTITNDYGGAGTVGICAVPTNYNMALTLDKFSVKNLDEFKNEDLVVGAETDRTELHFETEDDNPPLIEDPTQTDKDDKTDDDNTEPEKKGCGCGSSAVGAGSAVMAVTLLGAALMLAKRRKALNK